MSSSPAALRALIFASSAAGLLCAGQAFASDEPVATADPQDSTNLGTINVVGQTVKREPAAPEFTAPHRINEILDDWFRFGVEFMF